jgi:soluble lytic murein transglycosylase-like protein
MRFAYHLLGWSALALAAPPPDPAKSWNPRVQQAPVTQQWQAVEAMKQSLAAQRGSIATQTGHGAAESFFCLAPPAPFSAVSIAAAAFNCDPLPASELDSLIQAAAQREELQPELLQSIAREESAFRPCAVSPKGAMGLMQLMPATATELGVKDPFDPKESIDAGAKLLKKFLSMYRDVPTALGAYNAGPARVNQAGGIPDLFETVKYIQKVLAPLPWMVNK